MTESKIFARDESADPADHIVPCVNAALTAARAEAREAVAEMMRQSSLATGHGDTLGDLLATLAQQVEELRAERDAARAERR